MISSLHRWTRPLQLLGLVLVGLAVGTGCAWVGQGQFEAERAKLDHDGDGALFEGKDKDCDDFNAARFPGNEEIPYDGWDNDCDGSDQIDIDGDGYPGIRFEDYYTANPDAEPWPASVREDVVDCRDDPSEHPQAAQIYPGNPNDLVYDGIDSDCAGDEDFDWDADGYLPPTYELDGETLDTASARAAYQAAWGLSLPDRPLTDCDDFDPLVYPDSPEPDLWYDGVDQDCDGVNDFDADGDGYMPDQAVNEVAYNLYLSQRYDGQAPLCSSGGDPATCWVRADWGDCLDQDDPARSGAVPVEVHPGMGMDTPYDSIDTDCDGGNDFDEDGDGYMPDSAMGDFDAYETAWSLDLGVPQYGDCDDTDPTVIPGGLELLGDAVDSDCNGEPDLTNFEFAGFRWTDPRPPAVEANDLHYLIATSTDWVDLQAGTPADLVALTLVFDKQATTAAKPLFRPIWQGASNKQPLGGAIDLIAEGSSFWGTTSYNQDTTNYSNVIVQEMETASVDQDYVRQYLDTYGTPLSFYGYDIDLVLDDERKPWAVSCGLYSGDPMPDTTGDGIPDFTVTSFGSLVAMKGTDAVPDPSAALGPQSSNQFIGEHNYDKCFVEGPPDLGTGVLHLNFCGPIDAPGPFDGRPNCDTYEFQPEPAPPTLTIDPTDNFWPGFDFQTIDYRRGWHIASHPLPNSGVTLYQDRLSPAGVTYELLDGLFIESVDAVVDTDGDALTDDVVIVTVGRYGPTEGAAARLHYGDLAGPLTELDLAFFDPERPELEPTAAAVYADTDRIVVAVTATHPTDDTQDALGWIFLGWP